MKTKQTWSDKLAKYGNRLLKLITGIFGIKYATGELILVANGVRTLSVKTGFTPKVIRFFPYNEKLQRQIIPGGFDLTVDLENSFLSFQWIAKG